MSRRLIFLVLFVFWALAAPGAAAPAPIVVAIDTSRSLSAEDLAAVARSVGDVMARLPAGTPAGLLRFADTPQWVERPEVTPAQVGAALVDLRREGRYTLLHDAVFEAARALPAGGAVLVVSDGRDENSATTVDDIARLCEARGVRIFTAAVGARQDERTLRRLALVSQGEYLGPLAAADAATVAQRLEKASEAAAPQPSAASPAQAGDVDAARPITEPPAAAAPSVPSPARGGGPSWLWLVALGGLAAGGAIAFAARRSRAAAEPECASCGKTLLPGETGECAACRENRLVAQLQRQPVAPVGSAIEAFIDTGVFPQMSLEERLERTFVMQEIPVLQVKEPGEPVRAFQLSADRAFSIGRSPERVSLALPDPTLSAEHFRIVPHEGQFYLLDSGSTNGTLRNGEHLRVARLRPGDVLHAGQEEFTFAIQQSSRNGPRRSAVGA